MEVLQPSNTLVDVGQVLDGLNKVQREAVTSEAEVLQILAPPGSGKTRTLTSRVAWLLANGMYPSNIIVATFTNKASKEMKERISKMIGGGLENRLIIGTFHSIATRYLRKYGHLIGLPAGFGIADTSDSSAIISRIIKKHKYSTMDNNDAGGIKSRISNLKSKMQSVDDYIATQKKSNHNDEFSKIYSQYEKELKNSNLLDFDDLLLRCLDLLRAHPLCVSNIESVLIDEFQDTNLVQFDLMCLFASRRNKITIVGDPDQSIYGFRAAEIGNLRAMQEFYPHTIVVNLEENYRSSAAILTCSLEVIQQDKTRPEKGITPTHELGISPVLRELPTPDAEARWIAQEVTRLRITTGNLFTFDDIAILVRSGGLAREIETQMTRNRIPYRLLAGIRFFERAEVKTILDYLRVIFDPNNNEALLRILNTPRRGLGDKAFKELSATAEKKETSIWSIVQKAARGDIKVGGISNPGITGLSKFVKIIRDTQNAFKSDQTKDPEVVGKIIQALLEKIDYKVYVGEKLQGEFEDRWQHVEEFMTQAVEFCGNVMSGIDEADLPDTEAIGNTVEESALIGALGKFLATAALASVKEGPEAAGNGDGSGVLTISTIHNAKGLEWPIVFIPGCYNGSIPHSRAEDHDEERRLLYVAMTRAQALLYLSYPSQLWDRKSGGAQESNLCSFLAGGNMGVLMTDRGPYITPDKILSFSNIMSRECPTPEMVQATINAAGLSNIYDEVEYDKPSQHGGLDEDNYGSQLQYGVKKGYQRSYSNDFSGVWSAPTNNRTNYYPSTSRTTMTSKFSMQTTTMQGFNTAKSHMHTLVSSQLECEADTQKRSMKRKSDKISDDNLGSQPNQPKVSKKKADKGKSTNTVTNYFRKPSDGLPKPQPVSKPSESIPKKKEKHIYLSSSPERPPLKSDITAQNRQILDEMRRNPPTSKFTSVAGMISGSTSYTAPTTMSRMAAVVTNAGSSTSTSSMTTSSKTTKTLGLKRSMGGWNNRQHK
ncbi:hypothetical protein EYR41_009687 [Orbilia oligospora]|uniref:DNA 3'-5' helicase n=1 Tax=Orbilia oligospora TaxID=2813651 RepID=A0A7C8KM43_ORBOL|nr:hypothetical protein TWF751_006150 [Orbilia oligospora]TGJ65741.1 hypothetical protein EYR41_009687 [Orbilia oligospora]